MTIFGKHLTHYKCCFVNNTLGVTGRLTSGGSQFSFGMCHLVCFQKIQICLWCEDDFGVAHAGASILLFSF